MPALRTFRAPDARSALQAVKAALGPDAIIVSTRDVRGSLFRGREIEITAGAPEPELNGAAGMPGPAYRANSSIAALQASATSSDSPEREEMRRELNHLRHALEEVQRELREGHPAPQRQPPKRDEPSEASLWLKRLCDRGVDEPLARETLKRALALPRAQEGFVEALRTSLSQCLLPARAPWLAGKRAVVALVGPTGVGKTTTLAKIAARALLESKLNVALITVDTYRIGASEQVSRYGEIMRIPAFVAKNRAELGVALERCAASDLVLIDTAGRSLSEAVVKQAELIRTVPGAQLHLVLSAATGARELAATSERYRALKPERLIFTKLDESVGTGGILSATSRLESPVCALADGQRVPEDLHAPTGTRLFELVTGTSVAPVQRAGGRG